MGWAQLIHTDWGDEGDMVLPWRGDASPAVRSQAALGQEALGVQMSEAGRGSTCSRSFFAGGGWVLQKSESVSRSVVSDSLQPHRR